MKNKQLTIEFPSEAATPKALQQESTYKALDHQLADLMQQLNGVNNKTLKECTLAISKRTQEGQIGFECSLEQEKELLSTNVVGIEGDYKPLIISDGYLYLRRYWQYQHQLSILINSRLQTEVISEKQVDWQKERLDFYFEYQTEAKGTDWQKESAQRALTHNFLILSGGPGTGKTTTITRILALIIEQHFYINKETKSIKSGGDVLSIALAAPTGKAAVRMLDAIREAQKFLGLPVQIQSAMPTQANTLHKLLGSKQGGLNFKHNQNNPLKADVVIVDEASMIDIALMTKLVEAVPPHAKLILVGDKDQLSSVETGSVFADLCAGLKETDCLVELKKNWRFRKDSNVGQLAIAINQGDAQNLIKILRDKSETNCSLISPDRFFLKRLPRIFIEAWGDYFKKLNAPESSISDIFDAFNQYRILCALRRGNNGSQAINIQVERELEKQAYISHGQPNNQTWYHGRPIMITQNSYSRGLFNGDTGIALYKNGTLKIYFPGEEEGTYKSLAPVRLPSHQTTWAMTIHKSQGSEFDQVTMVLPHEVIPLLTRQLIYTGVTRAKKRINLIATTEVIETGVKREVVKATQIETTLLKLIQ